MYYPQTKVPLTQPTTNAVAIAATPAIQKQKRTKQEIIITMGGPKRKSNSEEQNDPIINTTNPQVAKKMRSPTTILSKRALPVPPTSREEQSALFQQHLREQEILHIMALNQQFKERIEQGTLLSVGAMMALCGEYRVRWHEIRYRFGGTDDTYNAFLSTADIINKKKKKKQQQQQQQKMDDTTSPIKRNIIVFGSNEGYQLGIPCRTFNDAIEPTPVSGLVGQTMHVRQMACGGLHTVALTDEGMVYSWGSCDEGPLGRIIQNVNPGNLSSEQLDDIIERAQYQPTLVTGFNTRDGINEDGTITQIAAGDVHTLFLSSTNNVYGCGIYRDNVDEKMCEPLSPGGDVKQVNHTPVHLFSMPQPIVRVFTGAAASFNAALLEDRTLVTWGFGNHGELARSASMTESKPDGTFDVTSNLYDEYIKDENGDVVGKTVNPRLVWEKFLKPQQVIFQNPSIKREVCTVACGAYHLLVTAREPGQFETTLYSSGLNQYGQLGHGDQDQRHELTAVAALKNISIGLVAAGDFHSLALSLDSIRLYSFGRSDRGQLGIGSQGAGEFQSSPVPVVIQTADQKPPIMIDIAAGSLHSMALVEDFSVYTWGNRQSGATGHKSDGDDDIMVPTKVNRKRLGRVSHIYGGSLHSMLIADWNGSSKNK